MDFLQTWLWAIEMDNLLIFKNQYNLNSIAHLVQQIELTSMEVTKISDTCAAMWEVCIYTVAIKACIRHACNDECND